MRSAGPAAPASRTVLGPVWSQPREECDRPRESLDAPPHPARAQIGRRYSTPSKVERKCSRFTSPSVPRLSSDASRFLQFRVWVKYRWYYNQRYYIDPTGRGAGALPAPRGPLCFARIVAESPPRAKSRTPTPEVPGEENRRKFGVFFCEPRNPKTETRFSQSAIGNGRSSILLTISQYR